MLRILLTVLLLVTTLGGARGDTPLNFGWNPPKNAPQLNPVYEQQLDDLVQYNDDSDALPYRYLYQVYKDNELLTTLEKDTGRIASMDQGQVGSCVGWGTTRALQITASCDILLRKEPESFKVDFNPAAIYAIGRSENLGRWDGSTGQWSVNGLKKHGTLHRLEYGAFDLRNSTPLDGRNWSSTGLPQELLEKAKDHQVIACALVTTTEEVKASLQNGYGVILCSRVGYASTRDAQGFLRRSGSWAHCLACIAYRGPASGKEGFLISNSWGGPEGTWVNGPIWPDDMPFGCFWITPSDLMAHLKEQDSYAIAGYNGFKLRPLKWGEVFKIGEEIKNED